MAQPPYDPYGYGSQDPYAGQPYAQQPPVQHHYYGPPAPVVRPNNGMATASMVLGILGLFACGFTSVLAIIFGHIAQSQIRRTGEGGSGMAAAGLILGYIMTVIWVLIWIFYIGLWAALVGGSGGSTY